MKSDNFLEYETNMPLEYYNMIMEKKDDNYDKQWHIRGHHLESLTKDEKSAKDNIMDSKY